MKTKLVVLGFYLNRCITVLSSMLYVYNCLYLSFPQEEFKYGGKPGHFNPNWKETLSLKEVVMPVILITSFKQPFPSWGQKVVPI